MRSKLGTAIVVGVLTVVPTIASAQGQRAVQQGPAPEVPRNLKGTAPVDLTGTWVSVVTEDWRWRMMTPPRGDYAAIPLSAEGRRVADQWDPQADESAGLQCKLFGAPSLMRLPGRVTLSWANDDTLKIEADAGTQTRLIHNALKAPAVDPKAERTWQGNSSAIWEIPEGALGRGEGEGRGGGAPRVNGGQLKVVTTGLRAGYLRRNGVPYSENARLTEYFLTVKGPVGEEWLVVTAIVEDPEYMNEPFTTSTHFKKEPDNSKFAPSPCVSYKEVFVPGAPR